MKVDITNVLQSIKEITASIKEIDPIDVSAADIKSMNHFKMYTDGIMAHIKANPNIEDELFDEITETMLEYRDTLGAKHEESQGKSEYISDKYDDIQNKFEELANIADAMKKQKELLKQDEAAKNVLASPSNQGLENNSSEPVQQVSPETWIQTELNLLQATFSLATLAVRNAIELPIHAAAMTLGGSAGLLRGTLAFAGVGVEKTLEGGVIGGKAIAKGTIAGSKAIAEKYRSMQASRAERKSQSESKEDDFVTKNKEVNNLKFGSKLSEVLLELAIQGDAMVKNLKEDIVTLAEEHGPKILSSLNNKLDKCKEAYLESCLGLSDESKAKFAALNDTLKQVTTILADKFSQYFGSSQGPTQSWGSKIADSLRNFVSKVQAIFKSEGPQQEASSEAPMVN